MDIRKIIEDNAIFSNNDKYAEMALFNIKVGVDIPSLLMSGVKVGAERTQNHIKKILVDHMCTDDSIIRHIIVAYRNYQIQSIEDLSADYDIINIKIGINTKKQSVPLMI